MTRDNAFDMEESGLIAASRLQRETGLCAMFQHETISALKPRTIDPHAKRRAELELILKTEPDLNHRQQAQAEFLALPPLDN